jgi:hypothetical protein
MTLTISAGEIEIEREIKSEIKITAKFDGNRGERSETGE